MTFPVVQTTATSTGTSVTLPSGIQTGDLIIVFMVVNSSDPTIASFSGYTQICAQTRSSILSLFAYYRVATGSDAASYTVNGSDVQTLNHAYRITGHFNATIEATDTDGVNGGPNPPSETASWGSDDNLWLAACGTAIGEIAHTVTAAPSSFTDLLATATGSDLRTAAGSARRNNATATEDPGSFSVSNAFLEWVTATLAIRPPPIIIGDYTIAGTASVSFTGNAIGSGVLSPAGLATVSWVGQAVGAQLGDFSIPGVATANFIGASFAQGALVASGVATVQFGVIREGALSAAGVATATFSQLATIDGTLVANGVASVSFVSGFEDIWVEDEPLTGSWTEEARLT